MADEQKRRTGEVGRSIQLPVPSDTWAGPELSRYLRQLNDVIDRLARGQYDLEGRMKQVEDVQASEGG